MTINIQIDSKYLEKLPCIGQQTHRDLNTLLSQSIDFYLVLIESNIDRHIDQAYPDER
jgi:hypothetical protein